MRTRAVATSFTILLALGVLYLAGCSSVETPPTPGNKYPETQLTYAPIELDTTTFRVHFYWNGSDVDGEVVQFRFAIDQEDTLPPPEWHSTTAKDTTFLFLVDPVAALRLHTFKIAAQDDDGLIDPTPATRSFSAKTVPPTSEIIRGPAATNPIVGPNFTFEWAGIDPDGGETGGRAPVDSFEYLLLPIGAIADTLNPPTHTPLPPYDQTRYVSMIKQAVGDRLLPPHDDWKWIGIRGLKERFRNKSPVEHVFAERAVDLAGAAERNLAFGRNIRHFTVSTIQPGPIINIRSSVLTTQLAPTSGPVDAARKALQIFEGETISFSWDATADAYGGEVVGYTYALDDTSSLPGLDLGTTGVTFQPRQLPPGTHFLFIRAVDDGGLVSNAVIPLLIVHPRFKDPGAPREILFVDDSMSPGPSLNRVGNQPSDVEDTNWWTLFLLQGIGVPFTEWDTYQAGLSEGIRKAPEPKDLAAFTTVVWSVDANNSATDPTALWRTLVGGSYSELSGYLRAGGTLILTGFQLAENTAPTYVLYSNVGRGICFALQPNTPNYNLTYFARINMGIDGALENNAGLRTAAARDFVAAYPTPFAQSMAVPFDTALIDTGDGASGAKWNIYVTPGSPNQSLAPGLPRVEGWVMAQDFGCQENPSAYFRVEDPLSPISAPIYTYHGVHTGIYMEGGASPREGMVCGVRVQAHDLGGSGSQVSVISNPSGAMGRMVHIGFPLYYLKDAQALSLLQAAFAYVNDSPTLP